MKTYQAILLHFFLTLGAAVIPTLKNPTLQVALGAAIASGTAAVATRNSNTNPDGSVFDPKA